MRYKARAPLRIDFGGGWTDVPFYAEEHGGAVLNAAITRYARGSLSPPEDTDLLSRFGLRRPGVTYTVDAPPGSGLGTSAAQTVLWVTLVKTSIANVFDRRQIAEISCQIAKLLGIVGGKQDEYASALGGISFFTFSDTVESERLELGRDFATELRSQLVLVYSGESRVSGSIHERVWARYRAGEQDVVTALHRLRALASEMREALLAHDLRSFGELLSENWRCQRALDPGISNPKLDALVELAERRGAAGGKACGAGGGGCVVFLAREGQAGQLRTALGESRLEIMDFDFDTYGVHLTRG
jgi:D-glycero-alpha-D-manno-heptose-7-phosphate kinase